MRSRTPVLAALAAAVLVPAAPAAALPLETPVVRATGLSTPWSIATAPDGRVFVTERAGRVRLLAPGSGVNPTPVFEDPTGVQVQKFLGLALHPSFSTNGLAYLYETYTANGTDQSRILRLRDDGTRFVLDGVIFDGIGSDLNHDGGRMEFGPDGKLYVTTGDIHDKARPRNRQSLNGKILRLEAPGTAADGTAPADNPFVAEGGNARFVWSYGHRHPQGLAWDAAGRLWETEHGPSGEGPTGTTRNGHDELNRIVKGGDYGWPDGAGAVVPAGTIPPVVHSGPAPAWAPGGLAFAADGLLYAPMLNGTHLRAFTPDSCAGTVTRQDELYDGTYGRLRAATRQGGLLWFTTDDGRVLTVRVAQEGVAPAPIQCPADPVVVDPGPGQPATPGTTTPGATAPATTPAPTPTPSAPTTPASTPATTLADRLLTRGTAAAKKLGIRTLLRRGSFTVKVGGLGTSRAVVRLMYRTTTVARGSVAPNSRKTVAVRVRLTTQGRRLLRGRSSAKLTLRTDVLARGARTGVVRRAAVSLER